ncbi:putative DNA primase/helicase [Fodinibius roseus]|uniref:Putative DNA primase/helicase n=1 Tax=Fodinibius roseus TaxID=1194090 RepID=A0A1M5K178_9BACT|nr:phage/plasmid primase, P4 family [Fodinibius roseus]SHG46280.1 putative DNA primase/helicase [Fodinibius roseus]
MFTDYKKGSENPTQVTQQKTEDVLKDILESLEKINFKLKLHPNSQKIEERLSKLHKKKENEEADEEKINNKMADIENLLDGKDPTQRDYKVISTWEILEKAKELSYPLAARNGAVFVFNGLCWDKYPVPDFQKFLEKCYYLLGVPKTMALDASFIRQGLEQFKKSAHIKPTKTEGTLLNFQNGTLEFDGSGNFTLRNHNPDDFIRYVLPYEYDPQAECPMYKEYLNYVIPEKDKQKVLAEFLGSVFSDIKHEKALILYGTGRNGKSVQLDITSALLGSENLCSHTLESLSDSKLYFIGDLSDALLNYSGEISTKVNSDIFKKLASGEKVSARYPYGKPFEMEDYARLAFNCNQLPDTKDYSEGFFRRFLIIHYEIYIPDEKVDLRLADKITEDELPGIMNWVLEGLVRLENQQEFSKCESADRILQAYRRESDTVNSFLYHFQDEFQNPKKSSELHEQYSNYCLDYGYSRLGIKQFSQALMRNGIQRKRKNDGVYYDVHLYEEN